MENLWYPLSATIKVKQYKKKQIDKITSQLQFNNNGNRNDNSKKYKVKEI